jgi:hypothetical protein
VAESTSQRCRASLTHAANAAISGDGRSAFQARQIWIGGMSVTGTYAMPGWTNVAASEGAGS